MRSDAGYTLIEVLIMLAITALLAATVLETVRAASQNGVRIERAARTATQDFLSMAALRRAIDGTRTDYRGGANAFRGDETGFSALTVTPIAADGAVSEGYFVQLRDDRGLVQLVYGDSAGRFVAAEWPEANARLSYFGAVAESAPPGSTNIFPRSRREWLDRWPPPVERTIAATFYEPLPLAVRVEVTQSTGESSLIFSLPAGGRPPVRSEDVVGAAP